MKEEEISLREIIDTLWSGKWIIASITAVALIISAMVSFLVMSPSYEADTTVRISQPNYQLGTASDYVDEVIDTDMFVRTAQSPEVLSNVLEEENLEGRSVSSLRGSLSFEVEESEDPSVIDMNISGGDSYEITNLLYTVINATTDELSKSVTDRLAHLEEQYEMQMQTEENRLQEQINEYNNLRAGEGLPTLVLFEDIASSSQFLLEADEEMMEELHDLDKVAQIEFEQINDEISRLYSNHQTYVGYLEDVRSAQAVDVVGESIHVISEPFSTGNPVSPNKTLNLAIALVLGLMVGVFVVFLRSYLKESE
ncbi:capsular polysaccharide biosynthesis protein [Alkalibacillus filiformis]|uniref:Capsular polysaccharide biosynthesis protein n=1 Tax=Alkalibacillus filiformis TaxID=200990 RepID=A0ABU0DWD1_9BACI|nr:Wzz/FepE/Etk N-terminal domain-containing protein [Alkalibacillus filiformis]MDQ0352772.1 capsular polysaccharide biosynthesis protein [Alkalibacillus filiformis]